MKPKVVYEQLVINFIKFGHVPLLHFVFYLCLNPLPNLMGSILLKTPPQYVCTCLIFTFKYTMDKYRYWTDTNFKQILTKYAKEQGLLQISMPDVILI